MHSRIAALGVFAGAAFTYLEVNNEARTDLTTGNALGTATMAYTTAHSSAAHAGIIGRIEAFIEARREGMAKRHVFRKTLNELHALNSRDLADLGICRSQIRAIAYEAAYGA
ncbi:MAG: DUF1127 domain-containing protein [Vannielia sp.]|nr:DUF1127 domain-containing protein [Vannielia sp.]